MATAVPIRDTKDTAAFAALVEREHDVMVTRNGYEAFHCLSAEEWAAQRDEAAKARLLSRIMLAEDEISRGECDDYAQFSAAVRAEHGL